MKNVINLKPLEGQREFKLFVIIHYVCTIISVNFYHINTEQHFRSKKGRMNQPSFLKLYITLLMGLRFVLISIVRRC